MVRLAIREARAETDGSPVHAQYIVGFGNMLQPDVELGRLLAASLNHHELLLEHIPNGRNRRGIPRAANMIQAGYWGGGQHGWGNPIRKICVVELSRRLSLGHRGQGGAAVRSERELRGQVDAALPA
jgi:hypothetical protein